MSKSIINHPHRVYMMDNFLQYFKESDNPMYIAIGKTQKWENNQPARLYDTREEEEHFKQNIIAMKRVEKPQIIPVIRNFKWVSGDNTFTTFDANDQYSMYGRFYCVNSEGRVYLCVTKGSGAVANEPLGNNSGNDITGADGYKWQYYYTVTSDELAEFADSDWIVIHFGSYASAEQIQYGTRYVNVAIGANHCMVYTKIEDSLIIDTQYHQIALLTNVKDLNGVITIDKPDITKVKECSIIYLENDHTIIRTIGKWEKPRMVLEF